MRAWNRRIGIIAAVLALIAVPAAADTDWSHFAAGWVYVTTSFTAESGRPVTFREAYRVLPNFDEQRIEITHYEAGVRILLTPEDAFRLVEGLRYLAGTPQGGQRQDRGQQWSAFTWTDAAGTVHGWFEFRTFEPVDEAAAEALVGVEIYEIYLPVDAMPAWIEAIDKARSALLNV